MSQAKEGNFSFTLTKHRSAYNMARSPEEPKDADVEQSSQLFTAIEKEARKNKARIKRDQGQKSHHPGPGERRQFYGGGFTDYWDYIRHGFETAGAALAFGNAAKGMIVQWLKNRGNRSVKAKIGNTEIYVHGTDDVDRVMATLQRAARGEAKRAAAKKTARKTSKPAKKRRKE